MDIFLDIGINMTFFFFYYIIIQKRIVFMGHRPRHTTRHLYTKYVYLISKHVGVGCIRGGGGVR